MRNLIFANSLVTEGAVSEASAGDFGIAKYVHKLGKGLDKQDPDDDSEVVDNFVFCSSIGAAFNSERHDYSGESGKDISPLNFVLVRPAQNGGNVLLPFHPNHYHYVRADYQPETNFKGTFIIPAPTSDYLEYTIIAVKKGIPFNERNKWTASVCVKSNDTAESIATKLKKYFDNNFNQLGLTVSIITEDDDEYPSDAPANSVALVFEGQNGQNYNIIGADDLTGINVDVETIGKKALGDLNYVKDLADKAAADSGFEYTYEDDVKALYPKYHFDVPAYSGGGSDDEDEDEDEDEGEGGSGFAIFTLRWAEPRYVKTRDEVVHQILQIVVPQSLADDLETMLQYDAESGD